MTEAMLSATDSSTDTSSDELLDDVLAFTGLQSSGSVRCVRARIQAVGSDVATCQSSEGETLLLPVSEYPPQLRWSAGQQVFAVRYVMSGRPWLSCNRPELVSLLAEGVVPELRDGTLRIMGVARAAGVRTKIAVAATNSSDDPLEAFADPVGKMIGKAANRVRTLSALLGGERLDVVAWHDDPLRYLANAFAPATVTEVRPDGPSAYCVAVPRHLMPAAVGSGGLNASLAGRLVGVTVSVVPA